jgi:hypothetical protein
MIDCAAVQLDVADALLADPERLDYGAIAVDVFGLQIVQETPALADQHQEATTRVMILHVGLEVLGEVRDPFGKERDLDFGGTGITRLPRELLDDCRFSFCCEGHLRSSFLLR